MTKAAWTKERIVEAIATKEVCWSCVYWENSIGIWGSDSDAICLNGMRDRMEDFIESCHRFPPTADGWPKLVLCHGAVNGSVTEA